MYVQESAKRAKDAALRLATLSTAMKNRALEAIADALIEHQEHILEANRHDVTQATRLHDIVNAGRPVVFISGHFSNFEIMAAAIMQAGVPCQVTYRAANNPYIDARIVESRGRGRWCITAPRGARGGSRSRSAARTWRWWRATSRMRSRCARR